MLHRDQQPQDYILSNFYKKKRLNHSSDLISKQLKALYPRRLPLQDLVRLPQATLLLNYERPETRSVTATTQYHRTPSQKSKSLKKLNKLKKLPLSQF